MVRSGELIPTENRISRGRLWNEARMSYSDILSRNDTNDTELVPKTYLAEGWGGQTAMRWERKVYGAIKSRAHWDLTYRAHILMLLSSFCFLQRWFWEEKEKSSPFSKQPFKTSVDEAYQPWKYIFCCGGTRTIKEQRYYIQPSCMEGTGVGIQELKI